MRNLSRIIHFRKNSDKQLLDVYSPGRDHPKVKIVCLVLMKPSSMEGLQVKKNSKRGKRT